MKYLLTLCFLISGFVSAQQFEEKSIYGTMALHDAEELRDDFPAEVTILATRQNEAAVFMTAHASHQLHDRVLVHGPGYIYQNSEAAVLASLFSVPQQTRTVIDFTITEDALVNQALVAINTQNIEDHIIELEDYGTRHHATTAGTQAAVDLKTRWEDMAAQYNRSDVSVRLFNHSNTNMPSVIMTIAGAEIPEEFVIVGGHLDSTSSNPTNAPGADDDASGIATITEATRSLFEIGFVPKRTIEVMAYAAEEIGLVGSAEIAQEYANNDIDVGAVVQFDMTNYNGSATDLSFITDFTDSTLNTYLMSLLDHYNGSGTHQVTYSTSLCNYGCSDHASWTAQGFMAAFPFEANFGDHNSAIHTSGDTYSSIGTSTHATKFAKLCAEFLIEASKSNTALGLDETTLNAISVAHFNGLLTYDIQNTNTAFTSLTLFDINGKQLIFTEIDQPNGSISTKNLSQGLYIASFGTNGKGTVSKKILIQ